MNLGPLLYWVPTSGADLEAGSAAAGRRPAPAAMHLRALALELRHAIWRTELVREERRHCHRERESMMRTDRPRLLHGAQAGGGGKV